MRSVPLLTLFILALAPLAGPRAEASLVQALSMEEMTRRAARIAVVDVARQQARWDLRGRIVTDVEVEVVDGLKDAVPGDRFLITVLGGAIGDLGMRVEGEPGFDDGARYLVFLRSHGIDWRPVGMSQGVLPIQRESSGREIVQPGGGGLALVRRQPTGALTPSVGPLVFRRPLRVVVGQVRSMVDAP